MEIKFRAQQKRLNMSECERLIGRPWSELEAIAFRSGWRGSPGEPISVPVETALNMLIFSTAMSYGMEPSAMVQWLPGLRNEALLRLGEVISNWSFDGTSQDHQQFLPSLYGSRSTVRPKIARILGCSPVVVIRQLRFHSQSDVEGLSNEDVELGHSGRAPLFTIDAHKLAAQLEAACSAPLFTASVLH